MTVKVFPYNPVIISIEYNSAAAEMKISFRKIGEIRTYAEVPNEIFYKLYYLNTVADLLRYYTKNIRKKFKLIDKKPLT